MPKIMNDTSIAILMATYNAGLFLREQIESILSQTEQCWTLYIQDDGSSDDTCAVISEYIKKYSEKIRLIDLGLSRQGCCCNFMSLLDVVESKYYMFCDQDDIWLPSKIEVSLNKMKDLENGSREKETPILVFTDRIFVDKGLNRIAAGSNWNPKQNRIEIVKKNIRALTSLNLLYLSTICSGNTMLFNKAAKDVSFPYLNIRVHDSNLAISVRKHEGIIEPIMEQTILYRLHEKQTCGIKHENYLRKIISIFSLYRSNMKMYYIWKIYEGGGLLKFLYYRLKLFVILKIILKIG